MLILPATASNDGEGPYIEPLITTRNSNQQQLGFNVSKSFASYLVATQSSIIEYNYTFICHNQESTPGILVLDIQDINNIPPEFTYNMENQKYFINWELYTKDKESFNLHLKPAFNIIDGDYLPENGEIHVESCKIDNEFDCNEMLEFSLLNCATTSCSLPSTSTAGSWYDLEFVLKSDFEEFLDEFYANNSRVSVQLVVTDGENTEETAFEVCYN